jgi:hypothetical protein
VWVRAKTVDVGSEATAAGVCLVALPKRSHPIKDLVTGTIIAAETASVPIHPGTSIVIYLCNKN